MGRTIYQDVEVEIDVDDVLSEISDNDLRELCEARGVAAADLVAGEGDPTPERMVTDAEMAARQLPHCPQAIKDLLWRVHGRALP